MATDKNKVVENYILQKLEQVYSDRCIISLIKLNMDLSAQNLKKNVYPSQNPLQVLPYR